jgi:hypothetical protein
MIPMQNPATKARVALIFAHSKIALVVDNFTPSFGESFHLFEALADSLFDEFGAEWELTDGSVMRRAESLWALRSRGLLAIGLRLQEE